MFQSTASIAASWLIVCVTRTRIAPSSATLVRWMRSVAIVASARAKTAMAKINRDSRSQACEDARRPVFPAHLQESLAAIKNRGQTSMLKSVESPRRDSG